MRTEKEIMNHILRCYTALSPENLYWDGERTHTEAEQAYREIKAELKTLFKELGRVVTEDEAYHYAGVY